MWAYLALPEACDWRSPVAMANAAQDPAMSPSQGDSDRRW
jgi:hypothetical protein